MLAILYALGMFVADLFKSRSRLEAENLFLRHQLSLAGKRTSSRRSIIKAIRWNLQLGNRRSSYKIRDDYESVTEMRGGFSVKIILRECREARLDLSEDDEAWILQRFEQSQTTIKRKHAGRLRRCARQLGLIEDDDFDHVRAA